MSERDPNQPDSPLPPTAQRRRRTNRFSSAISVWARDTFSREQLISSLKSFLWVAPLTILIWVYAEREQTDTVGNQVIIFQMKSNDPRVLVTMIDPPEGSLMAELRGSRVQVDVVKDLLTPKGDTPPVTIGISPAMFKPDGEPYTVSAAIIADQDIFKSNNVSVSNVSPAQLKFRVDTLVPADLEVEIPPAASLPNLTGPPVIEPRTVQITGPKTVLEAEKANGTLRVIADFSKAPEMSQPGKHDLTVPLTLAFKNRNVTITPSTVKVSIDVSQLEKEIKLTLPLSVTFPATLQRKYYADYDASLRFVTFLGPKNIVDQMAPGGPANMVPKARVEVNSNDAVEPPRESKIRVKYELPPGVRVSPADAEREVGVTLRPLVTPE